jgi:hypothetical protein
MSALASWPEWDAALDLLCRWERAKGKVGVLADIGCVGDDPGRGCNALENWPPDRWCDVCDEAVLVEAELAAVEAEIEAALVEQVRGA